RYQGATHLHIDETGALVIAVDGHELREHAPVIYQESATISGSFNLHPDGTVTFAIGQYDHSLPLVIDPVVSYSTLLGGSSSDAALALAVDSSGAAYVAGFTASRDFPTASPEQPALAGSNDIFVAKVNPSGTGLVYATYIGGSADDRAYGIAVDSTGAA